MIYIECPASALLDGGAPSIFLAGGITGCPDWQSYATDLLASEDIVILNPRRRHWPIDDPTATPGQIQWEHAALHAADLTLFWFAAETVQPIALLELGAALDNPERRIVIGAHPDYTRRVDVQWQTRLARPETTVHTTLYDTVNAARAALNR